MPKFVNNLTRFLFIHAMIGIVVACSAVAVMLATDFANLRTLVLASDAGILAITILTVFFAITCSSVQMGVALTLNAQNTPADEDDDSGRSVAVGRVPGAPSATPIPVRAGAHRLTAPGGFVH